MNKVKIPILENPDVLHFSLPNLIPHHVMIKDITDDPQDIEYYRKFIDRTYEKYIMTYETGKDNNNPHYHIVGFNNEEKNKFSNFKRGNAKLRKATSVDTKYSHLKELMIKWKLNATHMKIYYILKEQQNCDNVYSNLDVNPCCLNGYVKFLEQLPENIKKKTKIFKETNKSFLRQLLDEYPSDEINAKYWNNDRRDERSVKCEIFNHCLEFCKHWNITKPNAKSLAKKNFKDFCYTVWMQNYATPIHNDYDSMYMEVWGSAF